MLEAVLPVACRQRLWREDLLDLKKLAAEQSGANDVAYIYAVKPVYAVASRSASVGHKRKAIRFHSCEYFR